MEDILPSLFCFGCYLPVAPSLSSCCDFTDHGMVPSQSHTLFICPITNGLVSNVCSLIHSEVIHVLVIYFILYKGSCGINEP